MKKNLYRIKLVRNAIKVYYVAAISPVEAIQIAQKTAREEEYVTGDNINMDILSCELVAGENEPRARFVEDYISYQRENKVKTLTHNYEALYFISIRT